MPRGPLPVFSLVLGLVPVLGLGLGLGLPPPALALDAGVPGEPAAAADAAGWRAGVLHLHTHSRNGWTLGGRLPAASAYSATGLEALMGAAEREGLDWIAITDHNAIDAWFDPGFKPSGRTIPIGAEEWTTFGGHMGLLGFRAEGPEGAILPARVLLPTADHYRRGIAEAKRRGGVAIIHHPRGRVYDFPDDPFGADAVEVLRRGSRAEDGIDWWQERLREGHRLVAVGGSDYHVATGAARVAAGAFRPITLVRAAANEREAILEGLRRGHVQVLRDPKSPRVFLGLDRDGDGRFAEAEAGDVVRLGPGPGPGAGAAPRVQARVVGGAGRTLVAYGPDGEIGRRALARDDEAVALPLARPAAGGRTFVRVEVHDGDGRVETLSNPIHVEVAAGKEWF